MRRAASEEIVVICNFTPVARTDYRVPAPHAGYYREILNSDAEAYWGSNAGNAGGAWAVEDHWADSGYALNLTVPPLGVLLLKAKFISTNEEPDIAVEEIAEQPTRS